MTDKCRHDKQIDEIRQKDLLPLGYLGWDILDAVIDYLGKVKVAKGLLNNAIKINGEL
jgi:hypothetical protein